jgi:hypothetical protein
MWAQILSLVAAFLGVAATANVLVHSDVRRLNRIKLEAEICALLPQGEERRLMGELVRRKVEDHLNAARQEQRRKRFRRFLAIMAVAFALDIGGRVAASVYDDNNLVLVAAVLSVAVMGLAVKYVNRGWELVDLSPASELHRNAGT